MKKSTGWWLWFGLLAAVVLTGGVAVFMLNQNWLQNKNTPKYLPLLNAAEDQFGIPHNLLARQAYEESHFRDDIVSGATISSAGAQGIMQLIPAYYPGVNPLDVGAAINAAAQSMVNYFNQFGSWRLALAAYNAGPGNVQKYGGIPPFADTQSYVNDIMTDLVNPNDPNSAAMYA